MPQSGQTIIEYVLLIGIVTLALFYMGVDFKRGVQSVVKITADQMGNQVNSDQDFGFQTQQGFLTNSQTNTWNNQQRSVTERIGTITVQEGIFGQQLTNSLTNLGLTTAGN